MINIALLDGFYIPGHSRRQQETQPTTLQSSTHYFAVSNRYNSSRLSLSSAGYYSGAEQPGVSGGCSSSGTYFNDLYFWLAGARLDQIFLEKTSSISGAAHIYNKECLHFVVKQIFSQAVLRVEQFQFMQDIWLGQTLMKYDNIFYVCLKWILERKQTLNCLYNVLILRCHLD